MHEIEAIKFGVLSPQDIEAMAVCEVNKFKKKGTGSVYDPKLGSTENNESCATCGETFIKCPGHFGVINLNEPIINPLFLKTFVPMFLKCVCSKCNRIVLTKGQIMLLGFNSYKGNARFSLIVKRVVKINVCGHKECKGIRYDVQYNRTDGNIYLKIDKNSANTSIQLSDMDIYKIFSAIPDKDIELLGFDPIYVHPKNFLISKLPVLPPPCRPYIRTDGMDIADDDLTCIYSDIVKINNSLINPDIISSENKKRKMIQKLKFKISTLFDNSKKKARHTSNSRPLKGIKERIAGSKESLIRGNICGKRCNQTARTVIGPDPTLKIREINVPSKIARGLTTCVSITNHNYDQMLKLINDGNAKKVIHEDGKDGSNVILKYALKSSQTKLCRGDIIIRKGVEIPVLTGKEKLIEGDAIMRDGELRENIKYEEKKVFTDLRIGDKVNRVLMKGDYLLLNRQPTLHAQSMMAFKINITECKNISMNLAVCSSFNADFDSSLNADF
jgi:DNA-directed RNA polymerase beta' subunit